MITTNATEAGPLQLLIGKWQGNAGKDVAPEPDGTEYNDYREQWIVNPVRPLSNAQEQCLIAVQYHQIIHRIKDNKQIHDQCGYWIWDERQQRIMHSFTLPRGMALVAGGHMQQQGELLTFTVACAVDSSEWPIAQSTFLTQRAKTLSYSQHLSVCGDELSYEQTTIVDIYGKVFEHTDSNQLRRIE